jgi:TonB family protein
LSLKIWHYNIASGNYSPSTACSGFDSKKHFTPTISPPKKFSQMKTQIPFFFFIFLTINTLSAQSSSAAPLDSIIAPKACYEVFDLKNAPAFPGGEAGLMQFLGENIQYPKAARKNNIQGVVVATFVVERDGSISTVEIVRDLAAGAGGGDEVRRVLALMPNWQPGLVDGKPVRVRYTLPIRFSLD